jgi:O-succinylbenzoate synthase
VAEREGALLRADFGAGLVGYADLHPWPELGDAPLARELAALRAGQPLALGRSSLRIARSDAEARREKRSLFQGLEIPKSHASLPWGDVAVPAFAQRLRAEGFEFLKIKVGRNSARELALLKDLDHALKGDKIRFRLDANELFDRPRLETFLQLLGDDLLERLDFFEDPMPFDAWIWDEIARDYGVRLAADRPLARLNPGEARLDGVEVLVLKSAVLDPAPWVARAHADMKRVVFTSALDHPLGVASAAWEAARTLHEHPLLVDACGLLTSGLYELDAFAAELREEGPFLRVSADTGLGFDSLLASSPWQALT